MKRPSVTVTSSATEPSTAAYPRAAKKRRSARRIPWTLSIACLLLAACQSLSPLEKQQYENLIRQGAEPIHSKSPALAAVLNILPGVGDIYNGEWGAFALDFLLWVPSVVWAVPQGAVTAMNINKKATLAYYMAGDGTAQNLDPNRNQPIAP